MSRMLFFFFFGDDNLYVKSKVQATELRIFFQILLDQNQIEHYILVNIFIYYFKFNLNI